MNDKKMKKIIDEEIKNFQEEINESMYDGVSKKADIFKAIADFGNAIEKFDEKMSIQMKHSFEPILDNLRSLLNDVGNNVESFLDHEGKRSVILKKSDEPMVSETCKIKFYESLDESFKIKKQG